MARCKWCGKTKGLFESFTKYGFCEECNANVRESIKNGLNAINSTLYECQIFFNNKTSYSPNPLLEQINNTLDLISELEKIRPLVPFFKSDITNQKTLLEKYKDKLILYKVQYIKNKQKEDQENKISITIPERLMKQMPWEISISFGDSPSINFERVLFLAKQAPSFIEYEKENIKVYQATYPYSKENFMHYFMLYELTENWKSSFVIVNGQIIDKLSANALTFCAYQRIQNEGSDYCYFDGIQKNIFRCRRFSYLLNHDKWWEISKFDGYKYKLDKEAMLKIESSIPSHIVNCPFFRRDRARFIIEHLPDYLSQRQYNQCAHDYGPYYYQEANYEQ